jgi:hypothetical protein
VRSRWIAESAIVPTGLIEVVCHECHQKIDRRRDGGRYKAPLLPRMKSAHEERIQVTGIAPSRQSHILLYGANIGEHFRAQRETVT